MSRRDFIISAVRLGAIAGLVGGIGSLVSRDVAGRQTCIADGICARCGELSGCGLPQAMSAREALGASP